MGSAVPQLLTVPPPECGLDELVDILERVEALPGGACGAYLFASEDGQHGTIYVEHGRLCWAAVRGMGRRLTEHVVRHAQAAVSHTEVEALYEVCRGDGSPWGQAVVARGLLTPDGLREALGRHTAEAVATIASWERPLCEWADRGDTAYDAMFTFSPLEIAGFIGGYMHPTEQVLGREVLTINTPKGCTGAAYVWPEESRDHLPIACIDGGDMPLSTALELGRWAHNQIELARAVTEGCSPVTAIADGGQAVVAWTWELGFAAVICDSFQTMARTLSNHARWAAQQ